MTEDVLRDVCVKITGQAEFTFEYVDNSYHDAFLDATYNKGRMALLHTGDAVCYISFSEQEIGGRNSSVQSVPTAYNMFYSNPHPNKKLYYYFLNLSGNAETDYQLLIYRLMRTIGFTFLNASPSLLHRIPPFSSVDDIIFNRRLNAGRNKSNNSTFLTKGSTGEIEVYGKTYGANKYETSLLCYALAHLWRSGTHIQLYEVLEGDLKELPASSLAVMRQMGVIDIIPTDMTLEKKIYAASDSLRSPRYLYHLFHKLGNKRCALCHCEIPELIQGAHIWPVADIKKDPFLSFEEKLSCALDGENGLWLCENHHKLFDKHLFTFDEEGRVLFSQEMDARHIAYIEEITPNRVLPKTVLTKQFLFYLQRRKRAAGVSLP